MDLKKYVEDVRSGKKDIVRETEKVLEQVENINSEYGYFTTISSKLALEQAKKVVENPHGKFAGVFVSVKDSIVVKDVESCGGSKILKGYHPLFNATAVQKLVDEGAIIIGKTSQDEFGFGGFSSNIGIGFPKPLNPFDKSRACGGSSGGSAGISKKAEFAHVSLGESTGGSIVNPASFCGVFGLCPTYGRNSRYGLIDYGNSLDKVGPMGKSTYDVALTQDLIAGHDPKDSTSINAPVEKTIDFIGKDLKGLKIGVIKETFADGTDEKIVDANWAAIKKLESEGATYEEVSLPKNMKYGIATYYLVATSEASTNLAKYSGLRYGVQNPIKGNFNDYFTKVRSENFGTEVKRRIMLGTFARNAGFRDAYYIKALKVRSILTKEYMAALKTSDVLISPTVPITAPRFEDISKMTTLQNYMIDIMTVGPNLAGLPHMNIPVGFDEKGLPIGMLAISNHLGEGKLIQVASRFDPK